LSRVPNGRALYKIPVGPVKRFQQVFPGFLRRSGFFGSFGNFSFSSSRQIVISPAMAQRANQGEKIFRGIPVSAGVCRGKILVLDKIRHSTEPTTVAEADLTAEIGRLQKSLTDTRHQLQEVQRRIAESIGAEEARIFDAHLMVIEDPALIDEAVRMIQSERTNAAHAFHSVAERYARALDKVEDEFLRERASDMRDVTGRVLAHLLGHQTDVDIRHLSEPCILIAHDLTPSKTAQLDRAHVLGFATDIGSRTSHTAIMARSMHIPAVVGLKTVSEDLENGDYVLIDGFNGMVILNPTEQTLFEYGQLVRKQVSLEEKLREVVDQPAVTLDGHRVTLSANIESANDADCVLKTRADGVGLFPANRG
jgi:phosphotransferase system enzyme I (PtsI)